MKKAVKWAAVAMATTFCAVTGIMFGAKTFAHDSSDNIDDNVVEKLVHSSDADVKKVASSLNSISQDELSFTVTAIPQCIKSNGVVRISCVEVILTYEWKKLPRYKKSDSINICWDSSVFTFSGGSFYQFDTRIVGPASNPQEQHNVIQRPCEITQGGLGYEFDLKPESGTCIGIFGYARFNLIPTLNPMYPANRNTSYHTMQLFAEYSHKRNPFTSDIDLATDSDFVSFTNTLP